MCDWNVRSVPGRASWIGLMLVLSVVHGSYCEHVGRAAESPVALLDEDFSGYRSGVWLGVVDAHAEYHYLPETAPHGPWTVSTFRSSIGWQRAWRVLEHQGRPALAQTYTNRKERHAHPQVSAGDPLWTDYTLEVQFTPSAVAGRCGVAFRQRNDRCYYFFGLDQGQAVLQLVQHESAYRVPYEKTLAAAPFVPPEGTPLSATVTVAGSTLTARFAEGPELTVADTTYPAGKIALLADVPAQFQRVRVSATPEAARQIHGLIDEREQTERELQAGHPQPKLWKRIKTEEFGAGRNLRFGDLDGDDQTDVLIGQMQHHGPKDRNSELSCLTAVTLDGRVLWQIGEPDPWKHRLTNDVAFQIEDLDGDGRREVVYVMHQKLVVAEGATGRTLREVETPAVPADTPAPYDKFPHVLGDALLCARLRGGEAGVDLVLKDRYWHFWVYDSALTPRWNGTCNTGHFPFAADIDGDGRDELAVGYSLYSGDGTRRFSLDDQLHDHADGVGLAQLSADPAAAATVLCAASDEGMFFADLSGRILRHHRVGHAQNPIVANLRDDLPGLESLSLSFWGNQGIICLYDSRGEMYHDFEPCAHGSPCLSCNWTGRSEELFVLTTNPEDGGMFDGLGRRVVRFPNDGHPDQCFAVLDLTGDCRDEIVTWDPYELWVYTPSDSPLGGRLYRPQRNPPTNISNYQLTVSQPDWSE